MKKFFLLFIIVVSISFWKIIDGGYDKQNKIILFLKEIIPSHVARNVRDTVFIIPNLKERNKFLSTQVKKYEQGLQGNLFKEGKIISEKKKNQYFLKELFLPFPRLDYALGWAAKENSKRAHYLEIADDKVIVISG